MDSFLHGNNLEDIELFSSPTVAERTLNLGWEAAARPQRFSAVQMFFLCVVTLSGMPKAWFLSN